MSVLDQLADEDVGLRVEVLGEELDQPLEVRFHPESLGLHLPSLPV
jgi:hypothetical protein